MNLIFGIFMGGTFCPILWFWMMERRDIDWVGFRNWRAALGYFAVALTITFIVTVGINVAVYWVRELV